MTHEEGGVANSMIRFASFPRTEAPPEFTEPIVSLFRVHEEELSTDRRSKGLTSNEVLHIIAPALAKLGFEVETGKRRSQKIERPVFYGENGLPTVQYQIDAYHPSWKCGLEVEAGRAWMGNAVYRDLIQASVMVEVNHLCLAVPNSYKYLSAGRPVVSKDYENTRNLAEAIYSHSRIRLPYRLLLIGY